MVSESDHNAKGGDSERCRREPEEALSGALSWSSAGADGEDTLHGKSLRPGPGREHAVEGGCVCALPA